MSKISFIKSDDRKYNIERCLSLLKGEIMSGLRDAKNIVVKPNCVTDSIKLAATNRDALEAVLEFIRPFTKAQITLAEGSGIGNTLNAFKNFGYLSLQEKYDFTIIDLNTDEYETVELCDKRGKPWLAQVSKTILTSDYLISVSPPKTHDSVVYTGAIKNATVGSLTREGDSVAFKIASRVGLKKNYKAMIHQGNYYTNENIKRLAKIVPLRLAILDGFELMEGNGPIEGDMVPGHFAIASSDPLAADWLACQMMGIDTKDVGYLSMLDNEDEIRSDYFVVGDTWQKMILKTKMHKDFEKIKNWQAK